MKALILNSGMGTRMGVLTSEHPKCMTEVSLTETILSRQLNQLAEAGITEVVITTGLFEDVLRRYCESLELPLQYTFVHNERYRETNYIYSIYRAKEELHDDILLMHGDLVFENAALDRVLQHEGSGMAVSSTLPLPEKDFKAVVKDGIVQKVGIEFFENAVAAQALYKLERPDWEKWLEQIIAFCEAGNDKVYAENALNTLDGAANIAAVDVEDLLCAEIDNPEDLEAVTAQLKKVENRVVYMSFSSDMLHSGHIALLQKARRLGKLLIGVLTDEAVASYKRYPMVPAEERKAMFRSLAGVWKVVDQETLSYRANLEQYQPDIVVHGDDWCEGFQKPIRDEVVDILKGYGGKLIEFPYAGEEKYRNLERRQRLELSMPEMRRGRLRRMMDAKGLVIAMEAHDGLTDEPVPDD